MSKPVKSESAFIVEFVRSLFKHKGHRPAEVVHHHFWQTPATATLITINIITFIISLFLPEQLFATLVNYPTDLFSWRFFSIITSGFLHGGVLHLVGNLLVLLAFGRMVEGKIGSKKFLLAYFGALLISGIFNTLVHLIYTGNSTGGIGASGAIMGVVALGMLLAPFVITYITLFPLPLSIVGWLYVIADITGILHKTEDGIGHWAHIGGFLSVTIIGFFFLEKKHRKDLKKGLLINIGILTLLIILKQLIL